MLKKLVLWTALCACVFFTQIPALASDTPAPPAAGPAQVGPATAVTPVTPTQTLSPGSSATLMVRVTDATGVGVPSQLVNFTTSASGAVFLTSSVQYTDQNG